jgi:hypothetical protein
LKKSPVRESAVRWYRRHAEACLKASEGRRWRIPNGRLTSRPGWLPGEEWAVDAMRCLFVLIGSRIAPGISGISGDSAKALAGG